MNDASRGATIEAIVDCSIPSPAVPALANPQQIAPPVKALSDYLADRPCAGAADSRRCTLRVVDESSRGAGGERQAERIVLCVLLPYGSRSK